MDIYNDLIKNAGSLDNSAEEYNGMDDFLTGQNKIKVASIDDFFNFVRIGNETLIHKSTQDLWKVSEDNNGEVVILRLFDPDNNKPLRI